MVSWDTVCQPKTCGGLGFKNLDMMNKAILMKVGWNLVTSPSSLWSQVLLSTYKLDLNNLPPALPTKNGSYLWKFIGRVWQDMRKGIQWTIEDGQKVRFWWDCWVTKTQPLFCYALTTIPNEIINNTVADFVDQNGNWNWISFRHLLPNNIILRISSIFPPRQERGEDQLYWAESERGSFTVKSAYHAISKNTYNMEDRVWNLA